MKKKLTKKRMESVELDPMYARFLNFTPKKGDVRRARILEAAIQCMAKYGVEKTNFESIGQEAGMLRAHVAYYYPDRDEIIRSAIRFAIATVQHVTVEYVSQSTNPVERLAAFVNGTFAWLEQYPVQMRIILLMYYYGSYDSEFRKIHTAVREVGAKRIDALLEPVVPKLGKPERYELAKLVQSILTGHVVDYVSTESARSLEQVRETTLKQIERVIEKY